MGGGGEEEGDRCDLQVTAGQVFIGRRFPAAMFVEISFS